MARGRGRQAHTEAQKEKEEQGKEKREGAHKEEHLEEAWHIWNIFDFLWKDLSMEL